MDIIQRVFMMFNNVSCVKNLRGMFAESWANTKSDYYALTNRAQDRETLQTGLAELDAQVATLRRQLIETQSATPRTRRDKWYAIPAKTRIAYAHNRWLTTPKILVFTATAESIGIMFQLLHDSLRLARFLKRYEARNCREEDYDSSDFIVQARRFAGLRTAQNAYGKEMPLLIEWSLRRDPRGPLLIWNYSRDSAEFCPEYRHNVEVLSSRALFADMPDDDATKQILVDATRRAMGELLFSNVVHDDPELVMQTRELTSRYSNQPGDPADERLPEAFRRWMKEVDPKNWMQELPLDPGRPYWESLSPPEPSREECRLERELSANAEKKARLEKRLERVVAGPTLFDLVADAWTSLWLGLGVALANVAFVVAIILAALMCAYLLSLMLRIVIEFCSELFDNLGGCCCTVVFGLFVLIIISAFNSDDGKS